MKPLYLLVLAIITIVNRATCELIYGSVILDWLWPNETVKADFIASGEYDPEVCQLSALQIGDYNTLFVTVPRLRSKDGVPAGLNTVYLTDEENQKGVLVPYPNWEFNKLGNCSALQLPMSMAIDPRTGFLYIIDVGRVGILSATDPPTNLCPAKIVVLDTTNNGSIVRSHEFPDSVVSGSKNSLNDIVLDYVDPDDVTGVRYAYISDTMGQQLVVFDFTTNNSWSFSHSASMSYDEDSVLSINGQTFNFTQGINGIALSPTFNYVYYSALGSKKLWQIPTWVLRDKDADFVGNLRLVGRKKSNSDALLFGHRGLYYAALGYNAIYRYDMACVR
ncbi:unnamed protein product [Candidula unifasciata]|uniref:Uncharacterized protein n=1 Tax=Candidula unifasciata TaxID=100452 RepID=A0A8S3YX89_9EUPU|nr:unnamed protein product [Candidula unifasciata]